VSGFEIADRFWCLIERVAFVNHRDDFARFEKFFQESQILLIGTHGGHKTDSLPARLRPARRKDHVFEQQPQIGESSNDTNSLRFECALVIGNGTITHRTVNQVILLSITGEIFSRVIDDLICTNRAHHVQIPGAAYARHFSAEGFGNLHGKRPDATGCTDSERDATLARVFSLFPRLKERYAQRGGTLSGGEQQMLAIGRALMSRPRLLLLDEPSLGLAPLIARQIFDAIRTLNRQDGLTVLIVEQNANHALKLAHRGYVMVNGLITLAGTGAELLQRPEIRAAYLEGGRHG